MRAAADEPLVLVHRLAGDTGLAGRPGDVEEDQDAEVAPPPPESEVAVLLVWCTGSSVDVRLDGSVEVDVIALRLSSAAGQAHPEARQ